jgi:phosphatidate phosphatase PAH1
VLSKLVSKGYRIMYLTARPEWLVEKSRAFLSERGFPPGILHTTLTSFGATGDAAAAFKSTELARLLDKGLVIRFGFGNTSSDADAYESAKIRPASQRIFYQYTDAAWSGRRIEAYGSLLPELEQLGLVCEP